MKYSFILVRPEDPRNVGAAARALKTMGHRDLVLIDPCLHLCGAALAMAHGSQDILENAKIVSSLSEASDGFDLLVATTARHRRTKLLYHDCRDLSTMLEAKAPAVKTVGIVFGCESSGLSNDELDHCDLITSIPLAAEQPSVNLAQSVMIYSFLLSPVVQPLTRDWRVDARTASPLEYRTLQESLADLIDNLDMPDPARLKDQVRRGVGRLGYDDLYLVHELRKRIARRIREAKSFKHLGR